METMDMTTVVESALQNGDMTIMQSLEFRDFCDGATEAIGWSTTFIGENGEPFITVTDPYGTESIYEFIEEHPGWSDCLWDVMDANAEEWLAFFLANYGDMNALIPECRYGWAGMGHDYVLTAEHQGAGFWDRGYPKDISDRLCESAHNGTEDHSFWIEGEVLKYEQG